MCFILHIESATKTCSVALSQNGRELLCVEEHSDQYIHGEKLAVFIDEIMKRASIAPENLSAISISSGPGSYTGLRIGFSLAKGMCYALSIPLISIDTLQAYESCARNYFSDDLICVMLDARRMEVYSTIFDKNSVIIKPLSSDILDELSYSDFEPFVCIGDGAKKMKEIWSNRSIEIDQEIQLSANGQIKLAFEKFKRNDFENIAYFEPNYLKEFYTGS
jgi:tRNA threonylcarbamoyladenosine biosynthesis protein TsaB